VRKIIWIYLWVALALMAGAQEVTKRVGVVLEAQGEIFRIPYNHPAQRKREVRGLSSLHRDDRLLLAAGSSLTLSLLENARRYRLTGPLELQLRGTNLATGRGISELPQPSARLAVAASSDLNLAKLGGASSRDLGFSVYVEEAHPALDLDLIQEHFESSTLEVKVSPADPAAPRWTSVQGTLVHGPRGRDRLKLQMPFEEGRSYWIYWGDQPIPPDKAVQFTVTRLPEASLASLRNWEGKSASFQEKIEVIECYRSARLFEHAESLLLELQKAHPQEMDWETYWQHFHADRRGSKL